MTNDTITRSEAIDRMMAGLPCETFCPGWGENDGWDATKWADFDDEDPECKFRIPPEPRRVAREWWIEKQDQFYAYSAPSIGRAQIHVREVLPGDVTLQRMTEAEAREWFRSYSEIHRADFRVLDAWASALMAGMAFAIALGLLKDDQS